MKGFVSKRQLIIFLVCILLIGVLVPVATFAKSASGEPHIPLRDPVMHIANDPSGGFSFSMTTDTQCSPGVATSITPPLHQGDKVAGKIGFTTAPGVDPAEEVPEGETLLVSDTAGSFSMVVGFISGTAPFSFTVPSNGDILTACVQGGLVMK